MQQVMQILPLKNLLKSVQDVIKGPVAQIMNMERCERVATWLEHQTLVFVKLACVPLVQSSTVACSSQELNSQP